MKKKIVIKILFAFVILFGISIKVNAYQYSISTNKGGGNGNFSNNFNTTYSPITSDLTSITYYEDLFNYIKNMTITNNLNYSLSNWHGGNITNFSDYPYISSIKSKCPPAGTPYTYCSNNNGYIYDITFYAFAPTYYPTTNPYTFRTNLYNILDVQFVFNSSNVLTAINSSYYYGSNTRNTYTQYTTGSGNAFERTYYLTDNFNSITTGFSSVPGFISISSIQDFVIDDVYDKDFLEDNPNWDKVCVDNQLSTFSFIPKNIDTSNNSLLDYYVLTNTFVENYDISFLQFDTAGNQFDINYDTESSHSWWFTDTDLMYDLLDNDYYVQDFNSKYPNIYSGLLGWDLWLTRFQSTTSTSFIVQVFDFNNVYTKSLAPNCYRVGTSTVCSTDEGNFHGGGGRDHNLDNPEQYTCFYIPNTLEIRFWNTNDFGDIDDTITINGNDYNILTDEREQLFYGTIDNNTYSGFIGYFKTMLERLSVPITFINSKISLLFSKLPQDLQYMIIGVIALGFLIGLIKFLTGGK